MLQSVWQAVFSPGSFLESPKGGLITDRIGWVFIALRWLYYSLVFTLVRDYHGTWRPFVDPPFGMSLDSYARLQRLLALPFGFTVMLAMSFAVWSYLAAVGKRVPLFKVLNILGVTCFIPFLLVQPFDLALIHLACWKMAVIVPVHSGILFWECVAAMVIAGKLVDLSMAQRAIGAVIPGSVWILLCALFWR